MSRTTYLIVVVAIFVAAAVTATLLTRITAPYGRHVRRGWGLSIRPQWAWFIMESPSALVIAILLVAAVAGAKSAAKVGIASIVLFALWESHYTYRAFVYPFLMHEGSRRDFPAVVAAMAIVYNFANAYVNGFGLFFTDAASRGLSWFLDPRFIAGAAMFVFGYVVHAASDTILRRLRAGGETGYRIPHGGFFRFVSCPNYLGELIQWTGWAIASWSVVGLSFAVFTAANLVPRAYSTHRWYHDTFPEYPRERAAIIPGLGRAGDGTRS